MTVLVSILIGCLAIWMSACAYTGYKVLPVRFLVVLLAGLMANSAWMVLGLDARLTEPHALVTLASAAVYGLCAFGLGLILGRFVRQWRASAVDSLDL